MRVEYWWNEPDRVRPVLLSQCPPLAASFVIHYRRTIISSITAIRICVCVCVCVCVYVIHYRRTTISNITVIRICARARLCRRLSVIALVLMSAFLWDVTPRHCIIYSDVSGRRGNLTFKGRKTTVFPWRWNQYVVSKCKALITQLTVRNNLKEQSLRLHCRESLKKPT